jgi:CubicO group peptidase (beta-lactamase class C family)
MHAAISTQRLQGLLDAHSVTGASIAILREASVSVTAAGKMDVNNDNPVDPDTIFDAASLTKPLVAYAVLQLVDACVLDLDERIAGFVRPVIANDSAAAVITARHLLTHTAGLQNLRSKEPLRMFFEPGSWFSYSSVGFMYLQLAIEARTREPLETTMQRLVFEPLGMRFSSLEWRDAFANREAMPHEDGLRVEPHRAPAANASYSLKTTAREYAAFVAAAIRGTRLRDRTWREWMSPAVMVSRGAITQLDVPPMAHEPDIGWGLGWGLEPSAGTFFQWGKMTGMRAFVMGSTEANAGLVLFTNSNTGLRLMQDLSGIVLPGPHPAIRWLSDGVSE